MQTLNIDNFQNRSEDLVELNIEFSSSYFLAQTIADYELRIERGDTQSDNYWYLGLAYLLMERELDAQATWFIPFTDVSEAETIALTERLGSQLDRVASQKLSTHDLDDAWLISQYLRELDPTHINNLLRSILLAIELDLFTSELLIEWDGVALISIAIESAIDRSLLCSVVKLLLSNPDSLTFEFICQCLSSLPQIRSQLIELVCQTSLSASHRSGVTKYSIALLEVCLELQPHNDLILQILCRLNCSLGEYQIAIDLSLDIYSLCSDVAARIVANANIIRMMLTAGDWQHVEPIVERHERLLAEFSDKNCALLAPHLNQGLMVSTTFLPYTIDRPDAYRSLQNRIARAYLGLNLIQPITTETIPTTLPKRTGVLRIGYLASTLRSHSVGWLSRWLWQYHDRDRFQIFTYCINQNPDDPVYQQWFRDRSDLAYCLGSNADEIAAQICSDEVDILIDLDSLTLDTTCKVLAAKPAPIQVSWLGWDATGLPTVDYFIADRYVLPENAQKYYQEQIWRLPQSYLAVDGFEVGTPTIRREDLNISPDAIIYWSGQRGYKRHPQTIRLQLQIIQAVPNSYLLIKGESDRQTVENLFGSIATEIGVDLDRLRFLNTVADELTHRANLTIADVVLDTFPYNGATTTLETLWMGIPMVTQVGQQFAARNSYTFMMNAGITEGIAWSQEEYIEWGIKLGLDRDLRMQVREKLRLGRQTAPIWNAKQFTLDMEQGYREMWEIYQERQANKSLAQSLDLRIDLHDYN